MTRIQELRDLGIPPYSSRSSRTDFLSLLSGPDVKEGQWYVFSGRVKGKEESPEALLLVLADETGEAVMHLPPLGKGIEPETYWPLCVAGDLVELEGTFRDGRFRVSRGRLLSAALLSGEWRLWRKKIRENLRIRWRIIQGIRDFFRENGFLEVDTPQFLEAPGAESHLKVFETSFRAPGGETRRLFLPTSPEYAMKGLLVSGFEKIFQVCHSFRNEEFSSHHSPEFTMLEWYRAYASYEEIMKDTEDLIRYLAQRIHQKERLSYGGLTIDLSPPWERLTVKEAMKRYAGIDLEKTGTCESLRAALTEKGYRDFSPDLDWNTLFFIPFLKEVEPRLGREKPLLLYDYPPSMALLARLKEGEDVAERFELYMGGLELANAFSELCDPIEQRKRFRAEHEALAAQGLGDYPLDEAFLRALERGLPPSGGIALGVDRLVMLFTDSREISEVLPYPLFEGETL